VYEASANLGLQRDPVNSTLYEALVILKQRTFEVRGPRERGRRFIERIRHKRASQSA